MNELNELTWTRRSEEIQSFFFNQALILVCVALCLLRGSKTPTASQHHAFHSDASNNVLNGLICCYMKLHY